MNHKNFYLEDLLFHFAAANHRAPASGRLHQMRNDEFYNIREAHQLSRRRIRHSERFFVGGFFSFDFSASVTLAKVFVLIRHIFRRFDGLISSFWFIRDFFSLIRCVSILLQFRFKFTVWVLKFEKIKDSKSYILRHLSLLQSCMNIPYYSYSPKYHHLLSLFWYFCVEVASFFWFEWF